MCVFEKNIDSASEIPLGPSRFQKRTYISIFLETHSILACLLACCLAAITCIPQNNS